MAAKPPRSIRFRDALLLTQDASRTIRRGDLTVVDGKIEAVGPSRTAVEETIDARGCALLPGFVNAHTHVAMSLLRGFADDRDLGGFLERLFAVDARRTPADIEAGAAAGIAEMLLGGTTSFLDLYYGEEAVARAVERLGVRGFLGWAVLDPELTTQKGKPLENARSFIRSWKRHPLVTPLVAPQGVYVCNEETWLGARALAQEEATFCHYHLSETRREVHELEAKTGLRPPLWLEKIGFLAAGDVAAHGVWLTQREVDTLGKHRVGVVHCPSSNLKLATGGVCPVPELRNSGVVVGLGTDSNASNNALSMLREMREAGLMQKQHRWDASVLPAGTLFDMATIEGARLLGREKELGSLEAGKQADLVLLRLDHPTLVPARPENIVSHLAYSASEEAIDSVFVRGEKVVEHRNLVRAPWDEIRNAAERAAETFWSPR
ncbi:MAG TPA: amidohydrolase family protein [Thermoplasmata archaeon]|nr:amidohydrolase family protein [Thermoplasmata archaeon]